MRTKVKQYNSGKEYYFREGCYINELSNSNEDEQVSIARVKVAPGKTTRWHYLDGIVERYVIIDGTGLVEIADCPARQVNGNDVVLIPAGIGQRITNNGEEDLVFLAICSPRFIPEAYFEVSTSES